MPAEGSGYPIFRRLRRGAIAKNPAIATICDKKGVVMAMMDVVDFAPASGELRVCVMGVGGAGISVLEIGRAHV